MSTDKIIIPVGYELTSDGIASCVRRLREQGFPDDEIALKMDIPTKVVESILPPRPKPERSRAVQHQQLMKMAQALMPRVEEGEKDAISLMLKVMGREAALLGLDAPKEVVSHNFNKDMRDPDNLKAYTTLELQQMYQEARAIEGESSRA